MQERNQSNIEEIDLEEEREQKPLKPHPLETQNAVLRLIFFWVGDVVRKASQTVWRQEMNYDPPEIDEASITSERLTKSLSSRTRIIVGILSTYKLPFLWFIIGKIGTNIAAISEGLIMASAVTLLMKSPIYHNPENAIKCAVLLVLSSLLGIFALVIYFALRFYANRVSLRIRSGMYTLIHNKIMRFSILNSSSIKQGLITDLIEIDVEVLSQLYHQCDLLFTGLISLPLNLGFFIYYFGGWETVLFLGVNLFTTLAKFGLSKIKAILIRRYLEAKDKRMSLLRNLVETVDFVKINGLEDFFCLEMFDKRETEIFWLKTQVIFKVLNIGLMNGILDNMLFIAFQIYWGSFNPGAIAFKIYLQFNNYSGSVADGISKFIIFYTYYLKMMVSLNRLTRFLKSEDKSNDYLVEIDEEGGTEVGVGKGYAFKVLNGDFKWRFSEEQELKPVEEEGSVIGIGDEKGKGRRTFQIMDRFEDKRTEEQSVGLLTATVGTQMLLDEKKKEEVTMGSFRLNNINLEIKKGEKVAVIGGSSSGMSSLLYALIGEMIPMNDSKVYKSGTVSYLPQSRWLMACSVKENITIGKPFDEELLMTSLEGADMIKDIDQLADGIETVISDGGDNVSGGQKARIALSRCFYQW